MRERERKKEREREKERKGERDYQHYQHLITLSPSTVSSSMNID